MLMTEPNIVTVGSISHKQEGDKNAGKQGVPQTSLSQNISSGADDDERLLDRKEPWWSGAPSALHWQQERLISVSLPCSTVAPEPSNGCVPTLSWRWPPSEDLFPAVPFEVLDELQSRNLQSADKHVHPPALRNVHGLWCAHQQATFSGGGKDWGRSSRASNVELLSVSTSPSWAILAFYSGIKCLISTFRSYTAQANCPRSVWSISIEYGHREKQRLFVKRR